MLRSTLFRGVRGASTLIPSTRITPALTTIRHYAANPKPADPHHPPAESHGHAAAAGHHHDSHGATAHHDEHHHDDHGHHKHIDLSDGPYGVLFGEVSHFMFLLLPTIFFPDVINIFSINYQYFYHFYCNNSIIKILIVH